MTETIAIRRSSPNETRGLTGANHNKSDGPRIHHSLKTCSVGGGLVKGFGKQYLLLIAPILFYA